MAIATNDILRVSCRQLVAGTDEVVNVLHFAVQAAGTGGDVAILQSVADFVADAYLQIDGLVPTAQEPNILDIYNVTQDYPLGQHVWGVVYTGGAASGESLPRNDCGLILWITQEKRMQGKTYLGVFSEAALTGGRWSGGTITDMAAFANVLQAGYSGVDGETLVFVIWSRTRGIARQPSGRRLVDIPAVQRRRKPGRGS